MSFIWNSALSHAWINPRFCTWGRNMYRSLDISSATLYWIQLLEEFVRRLKASLQLSKCAHTFAVCCSVITARQIVSPTWCGMVSDSIGEMVGMDINTVANTCHMMQCSITIKKRLLLFLYQEDNSINKSIVPLGAKMQHCLWSHD